MQLVLGLIWLAVIVGFIYSLIKPKQASKLLRHNFSCRNLTLIFIALFFVVGTAYGATFPPQARQTSSQKSISVQPSVKPSVSPAAQATNTTPTPTPTSAETAQAVVAQMQTIEKGLQDADNVCPDQPCLAKIAAIPSYQQLYDDNSAAFSGKAADDFSAWRTYIGSAEGDMKQWSVEVAFQRPVSTQLVSLVYDEVNGSQSSLADFQKDVSQ